MDLTKINFKEEIFDGIWSKLTILHLERKEIPVAISSFHKIPKPKGILYLETKEGEGQEYQEVSFNKNLYRLFTLFSSEELKDILVKSYFEIIEANSYDTQDRIAQHRPQKRLVLFARKI